MSYEKGRLKRCPHPDCYDLIHMNATDCGKHPRIDYGHECATEGCTATVYGLQRKCDACKLDSGRTADSKSKNRQKAAFETMEYVVPVKPKRRKPVPIIMTGEQSDRLARKEEKRLETVRQGLNSELLAARMMRRAIVTAFAMEG